MWVKLDDSFSTHPKVRSVAAAARWTYIVALCHSGKHLTDGVLDPGFIKTVPVGHLIALCAVHLWDRDEEGTVRIHDYLDYNPSREQVENERRRARERRATDGRTGGRRSGEVRVNVDRTNEAPSRPSPSPYGSQGSTDSPPEHSSPSLGPPPSANGRADEVFEAVVQTCGWTLQSLTKDERGRANAAAKQLREVQADPRYIRGFRRIWRDLYGEGEITPQTLTSHWSAYMNAELKREEPRRAR